MSNPEVVFIVILVLFVVIIFALVEVQPNDKRSRRNKIKKYSPNLGEAYWREIRSSLAADEARHYDKALTDIDAIRAATTELINSQTSSSVARVVSAVQKVRSEANDRETRARRNVDYYSYLAIHYASHLAGNEIHSARMNMMELRDATLKNRDNCSHHIDALKAQQASGARNSKDIAAACRTHKNLSVLLKVYRDAERNLYQMEVDQNTQTGQYRDYIRDHFGERGLRWYRKLMMRKESTR